MSLMLAAQPAAFAALRAPLHPSFRRCCGVIPRAPDPMGLDVIDPSYSLALGSLAAGAVFGLPARPPSFLSRAAYSLGALLAAFGLFLAFQTTTLRFTFDDTTFALVKADLSSSGENVVVGGENAWRYSSFVNWEFFPSESFPILVYFKEVGALWWLLRPPENPGEPLTEHDGALTQTQTPKEFWNVGPGEQANSAEALENGAKPGQVHFFPAIANVEQLKTKFVEKGCAKL